MRTIKFFVSACFFFLLLVTICFFALREVLLFVGVEQVKNGISDMEKVDRGGRDYVQQCAERGARNTDVSAVQQVQLRFLNSNAFDVEVICEYESDRPITTESYKLPLWVQKVPGHSGFIWDPEGRSGVVLEIWGRRNTIVLDGDAIQITQGNTPFDGNAPQSFCAGYGYACCDPVTRIGEGQPLVNVLDCPKDCYRSCLSRPVVLRLNSDPAPDSKTRVVTVRENTALSFYYTIDMAGAKTPQIVFDFGDGQRQQLTDAEGITQHTYQCAAASCQYVAQVTATDEFGNSSVTSAVSSLIIVVQK